MKKIVFAVAVIMLTAGSFGFTSHKAVKKMSCCDGGSCCYAGSACCKSK